MKSNFKKELIKVFWIFTFVSVIGCILETIVCIVQEGHFEVRQGVIYGPFIPVYGAGAVLFYLLVPRVTGATTENAKEISSLKIFVYTAVLGGITEYLFSYMQECLFGTVSWEYSSLRFNVNGRTSLLHCLYWGLGGILFIKLMYPLSTKLDSLTCMSRKTGIATIIFFVFMMFNIVISILAGQRQYERMQNISANTSLDRFLDKYYPDSVTDIIFSNKQYTNQEGREREDKSPFKWLLEGM